MMGFDMIIAIALVASAALVLFLVKINLLPKKSLPFVFGAIAGIFGFTLWRESRMRKLRQELEKREKELQEREKVLKKLKDDYQASETELREAKAELDKHREAYKKDMLQLDAENEKEKDRIDQLYGKELNDEFSKLLNNL
jgi:septal ring factor EnvC (AmiA/AmiB activator)